MIIYTLLVISFLLDLFMLSCIGQNSILFPLFLLMSTIIIYPFIKKKEFDKFLMICSFLGALYDVIYENTLLLNIGIFLLCALIIKIIFKSFSYNLISLVIVSLFTIVFYRTLNYLVLVSADYVKFSFADLLRGVYSSIFANMIYIITFYLFGLFYSNKYKIERFS